MSLAAFLLGLALTQARRAILFRREFAQLKAIEDRAREMIGGAGRYTGATRIWRLPGRRMLEFGAVQRPGKMLISEPTTVIDAILDGGGFDYQRANVHKVRVIRQANGKTERFVLDLQLVLDGKNTKEFYVRPNDIIFVPEKFTWF